MLHLYFYYKNILPPPFYYFRNITMMERLKEVTPILKGLGADDLFLNLQENRLKTFRNWPFPGKICKTF